MQAASYTEKESTRFRRGQSWKINMFGKNSDIAAPDPQASFGNRRYLRIYFKVSFPP